MTIFEIADILRTAAIDEHMVFGPMAREAFAVAADILEQLNVTAAGYHYKTLDDVIWPMKPEPEPQDSVMTDSEIESMAEAVADKTVHLFAKPEPPRECNPLATQPAPEPDVEVLRERIHRANEMVSELCDGKRQWTMSIPAQPNYDPDLIIGAGLDAGCKVLALLDEARREATLQEDYRLAWMKATRREAVLRLRCSALESVIRQWRNPQVVTPDDEATP